MSIKRIEYFEQATRMGGLFFCKRNHRALPYGEIASFSVGAAVG